MIVYIFYLIIVDKIEQNIKKIILLLICIIVKLIYFSKKLYIYIYIYIILVYIEC